MNISSIILNNLFLAAKSHKFDKNIAKNVSKAIKLALHQIRAKTSGEGLIGSILNSLRTVLGQILFPTFYFVDGAPSFLGEIFGGALKGLLNGLSNGNLIDALTGLLGGVARGVTTGFQKILAKAIANFLKGKRNAMNIDFCKLFVLQLTNGMILK